MCVCVYVCARVCVCVSIGLLHRLGRKCIEEMKIYICVCVCVCAHARAHWAFALAGTEMYRGKEAIYMRVCVCVKLS
jgi:hypothetical protein